RSLKGRSATAARRRAGRPVVRASGPLTTLPGVTRSPAPSDADAILVDVHRSWAEPEVWDVADRIAHLVRSTCLAERPDGTDRRVAVFAENAGEAVLAHLGGLRSGASVVAM